jgi:hypothetical protein
MRREPDIDSLIRVADGAGLDHVRDEKTEPDRERGDCDEASEHHNKEEKNRVSAAEQSTEPLGEATFARLENGLIRRLVAAGGGGEATGGMCFD